MDGKVRVVTLAIVHLVLGGLPHLAAGGEPATEGEVLVARLVHPDRQAAEVLRLFEGARWSDPAAALAAWKQQSPESGLSKPVEAVIALFNPEMAHEWRSLDEAEIRIAADPATGQLVWFALIPRDDGTVAAGITAMRLTYPDDRPLAVDGKEVPVARLGRSGVPLACQIRSAIVVASSRDRLERAVAIAKAGRDPTPARSNRTGRAPAAQSRHDAGLVGERDSGTTFVLEPARIPTPRDASLAQRRAIEALRGFGYLRVEGAAFLEGGSLVLDVSRVFAGPGKDVAPPRPQTVETAWLEALPSEGVMAMVSLAIDSDPASWDRAFAAADRIERVDPERARMAPLRSRLNLLAIGAGLNLEADVRPHLRGVSACLIGDPERPGHVAGALVLLHLDEPAIAARLMQRATARLVDVVGADAPHRAVTLRSRDRDVWIAWGERARASSRGSRPAPGRSLAALCSGWGAEGRKPPARLGAFWPARLWRPAEMTEAAVHTLADDPPVIWWGWSEPGCEHDLFRWSGLGERVRKLLVTLPGGGDPVREGPGLPIPDSKPQIGNSKFE